MFPRYQNRLATNEKVQTAFKRWGGIRGIAVSTRPSGLGHVWGNGTRSDGAGRRAQLAGNLDEAAELFGAVLLTPPPWGRRSMTWD
jgi:hypothetical protein